MHFKAYKYYLLTVFCLFQMWAAAQNHPRIYINNSQKNAFLERLDNSEKVGTYIRKLKDHVSPYVEQHVNDPEWIVSRLQMYWKNKYKEVYVNGMDFSHGAGTAPVPTVRFSGSRDWATNYSQPKLEDVLPYSDDERGVYLQNRNKEGKPWEWVKASETGHVIEGINKQILSLAEDAAFLYWIYGDEKYAVFASDIFTVYMQGLYYRDAPKTVGDDRNAKLMGLQTFEVIHEGIIEPVSICYDFLFDYLKEKKADLALFQAVFQKWADQEINNGVPDNNWNLMQGRYITYLALALEENDSYSNGKGQEYYIDQVLNQNSEKQTALKDVVKKYDRVTAIWPETSGYSQGVTNDVMEIYSLMDKALQNNLLAEYPIIEKAALASFNYLFPHGFTVAFGDAKHQSLRFDTMELLIANYRKYGKSEKEALITAQLKRFIEGGRYSREKVKSLFDLFFNVGELNDVKAATSIAGLVHPTFYSPNVSWIVQRNGHSYENGMMISENASLGNHSHVNGISVELYAKGMVFAPDCAQGDSYWSTNHKEYYSKFAAHNTVVVDGISNYKSMRGTVPYQFNSIYPATDATNPLFSDYTISNVTFTEPTSDAKQQRFTGTVRTSKTTGYFVDIFRSSRNNGKDKKNEYLFHAQGEPLKLTNFRGNKIEMTSTDELSSKKGDIVGYDYFKNKLAAKYNENFIAEFKMPSLLDEIVQLNFWMKGYQGREIFSVEAPTSRAVLKGTVPHELYRKPLPTLVVRQNGEARTKPFVAIIDAFNQSEGKSVQAVEYFSANKANPGFIGIKVESVNGRHDIIYNDSNPELENNFDTGKFSGSYGVVSKQGSQFYSMLLHKGTLFEHENMCIEIQGTSGDVFIKKNNSGFELDASQPFILTLPFSDTPNAVLLVGNDKKEVKGKVVQKEGMKVAVFELPTLRRAKLQFSN